MSDKQTQAKAIADMLIGDESPATRGQRKMMRDSRVCVYSSHGRTRKRCAR